MPTQPGCAWVLTETNEVAVLPCGKLTSDVLTGPIYELPLRAQPSARLMFTHTPTANVNEVASALAGQTVKGDACLLVRPSSDGMASPSVWLDSLLQSAVSRKRLDLPCHSGCQAGKCAMALASALAPSTVKTAPPDAWPAAAHQARRQDVRDATQCPATPRLRRLHHGSHSQQRHLAMRAILRGRNAAASSSSSCGAGSSCSTGALTGGGFQRSRPASVVRPDATADADAADAAADPRVLPPQLPWCTAERRPCKSARSSRDFREPWRDATDGAAAAAHAHAAASGTPTAPSAAKGDPSLWPATPAAPAGLLPESVLETAASSWMELDGGATPPQQHHGSAGDDTSAGGAPRLALHGAPSLPCRSAAEPEAQHVRMSPDGDREAAVACAELSCETGGRSGSTSSALLGGAAEAAADAAGGLGVAWDELAGDVVACIAMQLPQQASQALTMAAVCRGWRAAMLGHSPLLRRLTFELDPTRPLRGASSAGGVSASAAGGSASDSGASGPAPAPRGTANTRSRGSGEPGCRALEGPPVGATREEREQAAMDAAKARQYGAGAFVLPSGSGRHQPGRQLGHGSDAGVKVPVPAGAAARLPRTLVAAAHASNPSAQLLMAQLLEGSGEASCALRWWRKLAQGGDTLGMFKLGMACYDGSHGVEPDPEAAHMWLGRTVRQLLRVDSLAAVPLGDRRACLAGLQAEAGSEAEGGLEAGANAGPRLQGAASAASGLMALVRSLDGPLLAMLGWSAIVLGYLEFDGAAGPAAWGLSDRSTAVRMFRLAEVCGMAEASETLGWLFNTGQY